MLRRADVWQAVDTLAKRQGLSPSGLARKAGLDPTAINKSKRATPDGRLHWPSTPAPTCRGCPLDKPPVKAMLADRGDGRAE